MGFVGGGGGTSAAWYWRLLRSSAGGGLALEGSPAAAWRDEFCAGRQSLFAFSSIGDAAILKPFPKRQRRSLKKKFVAIATFV